MKIFYTLDSLNECLIQNCPFGERHDTSYSKTRDVKKVGCGACFEYKYCYGGKYGTMKQPLGLIPYNGKDCEFQVIPLCYVKCSRCFNEKTRNSFYMRLRCWIWRNIVLHIKDTWGDTVFVMGKFFKDHLLHTNR